MKDCLKCDHLVRFISDKEGFPFVNICTAEEPEEVFDGSFHLLEVSEFNSKDCLYFRKGESK